MLSTSPLSSPGSTRSSQVPPLDPSLSSSGEGQVLCSEGLFPSLPTSGRCWLPPFLRQLAHYRQLGYDGDGLVLGTELRAPPHVIRTQRHCYWCEVGTATRVRTFEDGEVAFFYALCSSGASSHPFSPLTFFHRWLLSFTECLPPSMAPSASTAI